MYIERKKELRCSSLGVGKPSHSLPDLRFVAHEYQILSDAQPSLHHPIYSALDTK